MTDLLSTSPHHLLFFLSTGLLPVTYKHSVLDIIPHMAVVRIAIGME